MMAIHTVAAGGGSILGFDGARFRVGPHSAGANPGPASYRRGGPLTVTDANVAVGKIQPDFFPRVFGPAGDQPLDGDVVRARFAALAAEVERATGSARSPEQVAEGFIDIAVGGMANAIKKISVSRGYDVTRYTLQCFGGAGGQHACRVADALGMSRVFIHPLAGVLSAYGMGLADRATMRQAAIELPLASAGAAPAERLDALAADAVGELERQGVPPTQIAVHRRVHVRYEGTDSAIVVPFGDVEAVRASFEAVYRQRFAFLMSERRLIVEAVSVEAVGAGDAPAETRHAVVASGPAPAKASVRMFSEGRWRDAALVERDDARPGQVIDGPAIVAERNATTIVEPGWRARITALDHLVLERVAPREARQAIGTTVDPVLLEVFNHLFMNIAEQMGLQLQNTAYSVNIKERLDFSCALFDAEGNLIANAPHMPVHLGSMSESIKTVIARNAGKMKPGDVYVLNDPYHGGTHLPDVTVVTPVYLEGQGERDRPTFYVGSRGHHADIGGTTPGSMPPFSTRIEEEGVQIDNVKLASGGRFLEAEMRALLQSGAHPSRNPEQNLADLKAQVAANEKGVRELRAMVAQYGLEVVQSYMQHVQDNAEESVRRVITKLKDGAFALPLDNGAVIKVAIRVDAAGRSAEIDFTGTSPQLSEQLQCADRGLHGGGALRLSHPGGRRDPAQCRLHEAAEGDHPRAVDAQPRAAGLGGGGQRRDLDLHHQRALRRARDDGLVAGDDEQLHLRQRAPPVLRDDLGRLGRRRWLRRHLGRADAHDQLAPHRPRGARVPLPGAPRQLRDPSGLGRPRPLERRRRRGSPGPLPRADDRLDPFQQPASGRLRCAGRRRRPAGHQPGRAGRRQRRAARPHRLDRDASGRCLRDRVARRGQLRRSVTLAVPRAP